MHTSMVGSGLIPIYAILVCILTAVTLSGKYPAAALDWIVLVVDGVAILGAASFLTFFRMNRMF
jgi:hypothetical protein